jgi:hypothetical protein
MNRPRNSPGHDLRIPTVRVRGGRKHAQPIAYELEDDRWPVADDDATSLVREVDRLRSVPIGSMTVENLRLMLGQQIGTERLMPLALDCLKRDPLAAGDFYPGDLLMSVLRTDTSYWSTHPDALKALQEVRLQLIDGRDVPHGLLAGDNWPMLG